MGREVDAPRLGGDRFHLGDGQLTVGAPEQPGAHDQARRLTFSIANDPYDRANRLVRCYHPKAVTASQPQLEQTISAATGWDGAWAEPDPLRTNPGRRQFRSLSCGRICGRSSCRVLPDGRRV